MSLGKRARPPMKRTTSMTEFTLDPAADHNGGGFPHRRNSADFVETAPFLRVCSLCKRRLIPGHDIYMYRGDSAFCSLECRQHQMTQDERKEKCLLVSKKEAAAAAVPQISATSGTVAAGV